MAKLNKLSLLQIALVVLFAGCDVHYHRHLVDGEEGVEPEETTSVTTRHVTTYSRPQSTVVEHRHTYEAPEPATYDYSPYVPPVVSSANSKNKKSAQKPKLNGYDIQRAQQTLSQMRKIINKAKQIRIEAEAKRRKNLITQYNYDDTIRSCDTLKYYEDNMSSWERECDRLLSGTDQYALSSFVSSRMSNKTIMEMNLQMVESAKRNWTKPVDTSTYTSPYTTPSSNSYDNSNKRKAKTKDPYSVTPYTAPATYEPTPKRRRQLALTDAPYTTPAPAQLAIADAPADPAPMSKNQQKRAIRKAEKAARRAGYRDGTADT